MSDKHDTFSRASDSAESESTAPENTNPPTSKAVPAEINAPPLRELSDLEVLKHRRGLPCLKRIDMEHYCISISSLSCAAMHKKPLASLKRRVINLAPLKPKRTSWCRTTVVTNAQADALRSRVLDPSHFKKVRSVGKRILRNFSESGLPDSHHAFSIRECIE